MERGDAAWTRAVGDVCEGGVRGADSGDTEDVEGTGLNRNRTEK